MLKKYIVTAWLMLMLHYTYANHRLLAFVTDSIRNTPLSGVRVSLNPTGNMAMSNALGIAQFDNLKTGWYIILVKYIGYHPISDSIYISKDTIYKIELCPEAIHLDDFVLETARKQQDIYQPHGTIEIASKELNRLQGQTLGDMIKNKPGVMVISTGPSISKPVIRGLSGSRVLTINGGVRQEGQQWGADHGSEIDPLSAGGISIIKGANTVMYGCDALGGVVLINPRKFKTIKGVGGELAINGFSNNKQVATSLLLEGRSNAHLAWRVQGSWRRAGDARAPNYVLSNTGFSQQAGNAAMQYQAKKYIIEANYSFFNAQIGILRASHLGNISDLKRAIKSDTPLIILPYTFHIGKPYQLVQHHIGSVRLNRPISAHTNLQLSYSWQLNYRREFDLDKPYNPGLRALNIPTYELYLYTHQAEAKLEHVLYKKVKGIGGIAFIKQYNYAGGASYLIPNYTAQTAGAFLVEKWKNKRWSAEGGARYDVRSFEVSGVNNLIHFKDAKKYQRATALIAAAYQLSGNWLAQAAIASAWRPPSISELYSNGLHGGTANYEIGNNTLKAESNLNVELYIKHQSAKFNMECSFYRNQFKNFIYLQPDTQPTLTIRGAFPTLRYRQDEVLMHGIDFFFSWKVIKPLQINSTVSYLYAQNLTMRQPLFLMPSNRIAGGLTYLFKDTKGFQNIYFEAKVNYVAKQQRFQEGVDYANPPQAYTLVDINVGADMKCKGQKIGIYLSATNLMNTSYRDYLSRYRYYANEQGRNITVRFLWPFNFGKAKSTHIHSTH
jgi:iron complex outermembrane receptor protein